MDESQSWVLALTPRSVLLPSQVLFDFQCDLSSAESIPGVNRLILSATQGATPDIIAVPATGTPDGTVSLAADQSSAFVVSTANTGAGSFVSASARSASPGLFSTSICQTDPMTSVCLDFPLSDVLYFAEARSSATFAVFVTRTGIDVDSSLERVIVDYSVEGLLLGSTSVQVRPR